MVGAFVGPKDVDELADQAPQAADRALARFAQHGLEPGEVPFDWLKSGL